METIDHGATVATGVPRNVRGIGADARGVAAIEYALIAALIAVAIVAALLSLVGGIGNNWKNVDQAIPGNSGIGYNAGS